MLDFTPVRNQKMTIAELATKLTPDDFRTLTHEMTNQMLALIADASDADVTFVPQDPKAHDDAAATKDEVDIAWTLGHLIVHCTASAEEAAFLAAEYARGVEHHGRSRYEAPWQSVTTIAQCRARLMESRRMRLASLDLWPDAPHLDYAYQPPPNPNFNPGPTNAQTRFVRGLSHDDAHLAQIAEVMQQARAARRT